MALYDLTPRALVDGLRRRLKKSLGQNFLTEERITRQIAQAAWGLRPGHILEIGPGAGALTLALCRLECPITVLEKDDHCARYVGDIFSGVKDFGVVHGDALDAELPAFCFDPSCRPVLVSNLPYNVASQIYFRFIDTPNALAGMVLMFQREMAWRFIARPGTKSYGILSVIGQYYHEIETVLDVGPECFVPQPKVWSTVLRFVPRRRELSGEDERRFCHFVHAAFSLRRKTLANSLQGFCGLDKAVWTSLVEACGFPSNVRAEALALSDFLKLHETFRARIHA